MPMKSYIKPEMETIALRIEERISFCAEERLVSQADDYLSCFEAQLSENIWTDDCYRITNTDCS